jgi:hypothetical protein
MSRRKADAADALIYTAEAYAGVNGFEGNKLAAGLFIAGAMMAARLPAEVVRKIREEHDRVHPEGAARLDQWAGFIEENDK